MSEEKVSRRGYMKYVGGIVVVAVVAAAGYGIYEATKPAPTTPTPTPCYHMRKSCASSMEASRIGTAAASQFI